ncbi:auxin-induced protein 6B-like [Cynara cardunculus var. scolymus]|uniref:Auxin responsive SAUR protein n=1 Tax=Cynara cardunculus var. scolymus TaxID=59895 RepID=A0A103Y7V0_CYNCS|nr:auxin-induced protein 6B-like [Cynara cardunculus var. scolymus]KVI04136.1 Auxin responsive SAUR protein [Cynara cardunculus var. scolymus]
MSPAAIEKSSRIHHIVRVRQMLRRWRRRSSSSSSSSRRFIASDVPAGHVAICVGANCRRFIVRASYLNHPVFQKLLMDAEEEYGFTNTGPLMIPCEESEFEEILWFVSRPELDNNKKARCLVDLEDFQRCCHVDYVGESKPLLHGRVC